MSSYRPISNVNLIEKVVEESMKLQINKFFEEEKVIPDAHHGGRKQFSTITAKATLDEAVANALVTKKL